MINANLSAEYLFTIEEDTPNKITRYKYHMDDPEHPNGLNPLKHFCKNIRF